MQFTRGDQNYSDSSVTRGVDGVGGDTLRSSFQFGASVEVSATIFPNGSISGTVSGDGSVFPFTFPPWDYSIDGTNFEIDLWGPDGRCGSLTYPTVDDLQLEYCSGPSPDQQPQSSIDVPAHSVSLEHLWEWSNTSGRFVNPGSAGVTINPELPTYLLTHGWDGQLSGNRCGTLPDDATCAALGSSTDEPEFAMSSVGAAIRRLRGDSVNLLAWDWADVANPNGCDVSQWLNGPPEVQEAIQNLLDHPSFRNIWEVFRSDAAQTLCYLTSFNILNDAWRSGLAARGEGNKLGTALADEIAAHGAIGSQLHLIGKSHGGAVMGQAAKALKERGVRIDSLTTLDTPKILCLPWTNACYVNSLQFIEPPAAERTFVLYYDTLSRGGLGAPLEGSSSTVANIRLSPEHAPPLPSILHLWVAGNDDCECVPEDGSMSRS